MTRSLERSLNPRASCVFVDNRRAFMQAAHIQRTRARCAFFEPAAQLLCAAQQLSECKFWMRLVLAGINSAQL
jgi:hypothetical protein